jgi:putative ATP-binding cassette transporter
MILAAPILAGGMNYGDFAQANVAYNLVESSLFFIVYNIEALARFSASINRLEGFQSNISTLDRSEWSDYVSKIVPSESLALRGITVKTPRTENVLVRDLSFSLEVAEGLLVVGPSGCGKTSLLRVVSGLWGSPTGTVYSPEQGDLLFIPQKPYMVLGSLREQLCYPLDQARFSDEQLRAVLDQVMCTKLMQRYPDLDIKQDWQRLLSLGEQQRLAFARLLLNSPKVVVLDEATSALDVKTEERLYSLLREREVSFISVGHRPTLKNFHDNVLEVLGDGSWRLMPATSYDFRGS